VRVTVEVAVGVGEVVGVAVCVTVGERVWVDVIEGSSTAITLGVAVDMLQAESRMLRMKIRHQ